MDDEGHGGAVTRRLRAVSPSESPEPGSGEALADLLRLSARGDAAAFEKIYDSMADAVFGLAVRVLRNHAQAEEVAQDVMVEVWRSAARYAPVRGSARSWIMTIAHRRAVDRVRSEQASTDRDARVAAAQESTPFDEVAEQVETSFEYEQARRCLEALTELQREAVRLAYYDGYTYREVADLLEAPLGTIKTRLRDGLIRLRDCVGLG